MEKKQPTLNEAVQVLEQVNKELDILKDVVETFLDEHENFTLIPTIMRDARSKNRGAVTPSWISRRFQKGYSRSCRIIDLMHSSGLIQLANGGSQTMRQAVVETPPSPIRQAEQITAPPAVKKNMSVVGTWTGTIQSKRSSSGKINSAIRPFSITVDPDIKSGSLTIQDQAGPIGIIKQGDELVINDPRSPGMTSKLKMTLNFDGTFAEVLLRMDNGVDAWGEAEGTLFRQ